jgi:glycolate oxidase FAD binding subunit
LIGSLGTLGIITQATLKLRPLAEEQALVTLGCDAEHLDKLLTHLHGTRTRPMCIELLNRPAAERAFRQASAARPDTAWTLVVGYEGNVAAVEWQVQQLIKETCPACPIEARLGFTAQPLADALVEAAGWPEVEMTCKVNLVPSGVAAFVQMADAANDQPALRVHAGSGIVYGAWPAGLTVERAIAILKEWRLAANAGQGGVVVQSCPANWKNALSVWGPAPNDAWLMRTVKDAFDPRRRFNPGRFIDGI